MRMLLTVRNLWIALPGLFLVTSSLLIAPGPLSAQVSQTEPDRMGAESPARRYKRLMWQQRPLVEAAAVMRDVIDEGAYEGYAGIVIEDGAVALWWKGNLPASISEAVADTNLIAPIEIREAKYSLAELREAAAQIRAQLGPGSMIHSIKDPGDGSRLILAAPLEALSPRTEALIAQSLPNVVVDYELVFEQPLQPISRNDDSPPWQGGAVIINRTIGAGCTSGFGVIANGRQAVLTAGHCATANGQMFTDGVGEFIGNAAQKTNHDQLIIPTTSAGNRIYIGPRVSNTTKLVTGWQACFIGELICQSGVTTAQAIGSELCGFRVDRFNLDSESLVEAVQINGQNGARPGDSGGPLYSDRGATVIAKGTMTRVAGARIGFQDIPTANQDFGGIQIPGSAVVKLFQHCNFGGWQANFHTTGNISLAQIQNAGGLNNDASSIIVASGFRVTLFSGANQTGSSVTVTGNTSCFVNLNFNDILTSMRIESIQ